MVIPKFKPSKRFLDRYEVPCLVAKIKNSEVGLAKQYVAKYKKELPFEIYLRGREPQTISPWQQQQLELLFKNNGLIAALVEGLSKSCYSDDVDKEDRKFYEAHGYSPYFCVRELVIDDIKQKVIFLVDDAFHVLHEHLGVIYLKGGRWCYEEYDYYLRYGGAFEKFSLEAKAEELKRQQWQEKFDAIYPPPDSKLPIEKDCSQIFGRWIPDNTATKKLSKQLGDSFYPETQDYIFSEWYVKSWPLESGRILEMRRQGSWITIKRKTCIPGDGDVLLTSQSKFWCDGRRLVTESGKAYKRAGVKPLRRYTIGIRCNLPGPERATDLAMDEIHPRLFISRESAVDVVDGMSGDGEWSLRARRSVGMTPHVRRLARLKNDCNRVFWFADGATHFGAARFSGGEFETLLTPKAGKSPVTAQYLRATGELYVFNVGDASATVYKLANDYNFMDGGKATRTIRLPASPVAAACDTQSGLVYCTMKGRNEIAVIDAKTHNVKAVWPIAPGVKPSGLAMDLQFQRLFVNCANQKLIMLDGLTGKVIASIATGKGAVTCAIDSQERLLFSIAADGLLTIAHLASPESLTVVQSLKTRADAQSLAHYSRSGMLFMIENDSKSGAKLLVYIRD